MLEFELMFIFSSFVSILNYLYVYGKVVVQVTLSIIYCAEYGHLWDG